MKRQLAAVLVLAQACLALVGCATNPVTGKPNVVVGTQQGEKEQSRRYYQQIIQAYGLYEDQALQDYVNSVGQRVGKNSHLPTGTSSSRYSMMSPSTRSRPAADTSTFTAACSRT